MAAMYVRGEVAQENLRLMLLAYGLENAYRVVTLEEIARSLRHFRRDEIKDGLDHLFEEGLLMKFSGRYCFNKSIPNEVRNHIERSVTPSGTIKMK
jgi:hypothetical protein